MAIYAFPGEMVTISFQWQNNGVLPFDPQFRMQMYNMSGGLVNWNDTGASWITSPAVNPGGTSPQLSVRQPVPSDWGPNTKIRLKITAQLPGYFGETTLQEFDDAVEVPSIGADWIAVINPKLSVA